jgi:cytidylate kinase
MSFVIAIDGPASSGKGTLAKKLAAHYDLPHLDTGLLYRAVAAAMLAANASLEDAGLAGMFAKRLQIHDMIDESLRKVKLGEAASIIAAHKEVRAALFDIQRSFANSGRGAVLDGRDIGTVICPDAAVKIFITASPEVRAQRRLKEFLARGQETTYDAVMETIKKRDWRDETRADAPLKKADDALLLDTSDLDIDQAFQAAVGMIDAAIKGKIPTGS